MIFKDFLYLCIYLYLFYNIGMNDYNYNKQTEYNRKLPEMVYSIEEFRNVFREFGIDEDNVRFYLGKYHLSPKAFGIYQIADNYIVYKVKANGETSIRYEGKDEQYAVKELYLKFLQEVSKRTGLNEKYNPYYDPNYKVDNRVKQKEYYEKKKKRLKYVYTFVFIVIAIIVISFIILPKVESKPKYYQYQNRYYSKYNNNWYYWNDISDEWVVFYPANSEYSNYYEIDDPDYRDYDRYEIPSNGSHDSYSDSFDSYDFGSDGYTDWDSDW